MKHKAITYKLIIIFTFISNISLAQITIESKTEPKSPLDTIHVKKERLDDMVDSYGEEITNDVPNKITYLITDANVVYQDINIKADFISINWNSGDVFARGKIDDKGKITEKTTFEQGGKSFKYQSFKYNFKTGQGTVYNVQTKEGEGMIDAEKSKRYNDSIFYLSHARYTTDKYYIEEKDTVSDFYLAIQKAKFLKSKNTDLAIAGPTQFVLEQVPTPLLLPFLFLPLSSERSAGIIIPSFGERDNLGFFLQGGGFYLPIGDYFDIQVLGDFYTKGSWGTQVSSQYKKRYKYSGNVQFNYENTIEGVRGMTIGSLTYKKSNNFKFNWSHSQDSKANPYSNLSASVNFMSAKFYANTINNTNINTGNILNNTTNSSVNWSKTFENFPMNISLNGSYFQTLSTGTSTLTLPTLTANLRRQFPFRTGHIKVGLAKNFYFDYRMQAMNVISGNTDDLLSTENLKSARNGLKHQINIGTSTTLFNFYPITFSGSFDEVWSLKEMYKYYDLAQNKVIEEDLNQFSAYRVFNTSVSVNSTWYKTVNFGKDKKIQAIRHTISPTVSYNFTPDFTAEAYDYFRVYRNENGQRQLYNRFQNGAYGGPSQAGLSSSIGLSISNNLEMKVRSNNDSIEVKKIKIFDYLNLATSYDLVRDSLNLSPISINGATSFFDSKLRVNFGTSINPYKIHFASSEVISGTQVNEYKLSLSSYNIGLNFGLDNTLFKGEEINKKYKRKGTIRYEEYYFDEEDYAHFAVPWSMSFGFVYNYSKGFQRDGIHTASANISGSISPSPYWKLSGTTNYDFVSQKFTFTTINLSRDLRSFTINFNWVPFGSYRTWDFLIGIKATILRDAVKYDESDYSRFRNNSF